ncbi:MAG: DUF6100 family protein [Firmicutes bacterium]|nr:DUF6100 family protein [Bacillota bacterium]
MEQKKSGFERCLDSANRRTGKVWAALEETQLHLKRGDMISAYEAAFEAAGHAEKLTCLCRELPAYTGYPKARAAIEEATSKNFPVEIGFTAEGWFCLRIPLLLPKKNKGSPAYLCDPLYPAMRRFWKGKQPMRYPYNVTIFRHVYNRARPERQYRDHDNTELNRVLDIVALYVMVDDSPVLCRHYYCSAPGGSERTEVYVVPQNEFIRWLEQEKTIPDGGVLLYENRP